MAVAPADEVALSTYERAFVLAAVRALGLVAEPFLVAATKANAQAMAHAARALAGDAVARARELQRLDAAPPEGIERVHPTWWARPPLGGDAAARAWLDRAATAHLVAMVSSSTGNDTSPLAALAELPAEPLAELLAALGRRRIAEAFSGAPPGSLAQLCARLGEPAASMLLAEARAARPSHEAVRAAQRSLFKLAVDVLDGPSLLAHAGARWLAPSLQARGGDLLRRVAQRLPERAGRILLAERDAPATVDEHAECERAVAELGRRA